MVAALRLLLAVAIAACSAAAHAEDPPARVGRLALVSGPVSLAPADAPDQWVAAPINRPLTSGDRLWADAEARASVHVGPTAVRVAPHTALDVLHLDDDMLQLRLAQGAVHLRVRELIPDELIEIATPDGAVVITQPGRYRVSVDPQHDVTRVAVHFGQAQIVTPHSQFVVPSSQAAVLAAGEAPLFEVLTEARADAFDRWAADLDRREDRPLATRYVSPHMTGHQDLDHHGSWRTVPAYGDVWFPRVVSPGWAPYRYGRWTWISPWGWTWIDDAPWGFAPFHYGRWVRVDNDWGWAPGPIVARPVYAPALVAFVGGAGWSLSFASGPAVGWFPLGWREPFIPWYRASTRHIHRVNITHVTNITHIHRTHIRHVHRHRPDAVTVIPREAFVSSRRAGQARFTRLGRGELARAEIVRARPADPTRRSIAADRSGQRPPARALSREVVAVTPSRQRARVGTPVRERGTAFARSESAPPVRVIEARRDEWRTGGRRGQAGAGAPRAAAAEADSAGSDAVRGRFGNGPGFSERPRTPGAGAAARAGAPAPREWRAPTMPQAAPSVGRSVGREPGSGAAPSGRQRPDFARDRPGRPADAQRGARERVRTAPQPGAAVRGQRVLPSAEGTGGTARAQRFRSPEAGAGLRMPQSARGSDRGSARPQRHQRPQTGMPREAPRSARTPQSPHGTARADGRAPRFQAQQPGGARASAPRSAGPQMQPRSGSRGEAGGGRGARRGAQGR